MSGSSDSGRVIDDKDEIVIVTAAQFEAAVEANNWSAMLALYETGREEQQPRKEGE